MTDLFNAPNDAQEAAAHARIQAADWHPYSGSGAITGFWIRGNGASVRVCTTSEVIAILDTEEAARVAPPPSEA